MATYTSVLFALLLLALYSPESLHAMPPEPMKPTEPTEPTEPMESTEPTEPTNPTEPTKPTEPTEAMEHTDQIEPIEPIEPIMEPCTSTECLGAAYRIKKSMDESKDPCNNFYQFACGGYIKETRIPADKSSFSPYSNLREVIYDQARNILEEESDSDWDLFKKVKAHYRDCLDEKRQEELGLKPMQDILDNIGGWPVITGKPNPNDWTDLMAAMADLGFSSNEHLLRFYVDLDKKNKSRWALNLDKPDSFGISQEFLIGNHNSTQVQAYLEYMTKTAELFGAEPEVAKVKMGAVLDLEIDLANASLKRAERRNESRLYNPKTFGQLNKDKRIDYKAWINKVGQFSPLLEDDDVVIVNDLQLFNQFEDIIYKRLNDNSKRDAVSNYLIWRSIMSIMDNLDTKARNLKLAFDKSISGTKSIQAVWKRCALKVGFNSYTRPFRYTSGSMYVQRYFGTEAKAIMLDLTKRQRLELKTILDNIEWMDDETRRKAHLKLKQLNSLIAFPDEIINEELMEDVHREIPFKKEDFFGTQLGAKRFWNLYQLSLLPEPALHNHWLTRYNALVAVVNAFNDFSTNSMLYPAGILQGVFFNADVPSSLNYASIGSIIGHEISHGFDDQGRQYNERGQVINWWTPDTDARFRERAQCVIDYYGNFTAEQVKMNLNGVTTQGENIADLVGVKLAYKAFESLLQDDPGASKPLPGLPYTARQLFWIARGTSICQVFRDQALINQIKSQPHAPGEFRILGPFQNSEEFARDFNCPAGSPMNPQKKCIVW